MDKINIEFANSREEFPIIKAAIGENVVDMRSFNKSGMWSYDPAFLSTAACESKITYINGDKGQLFYRGYPIEQLAQKSNHLEGAYLLLNGELPNKNELANFENRLITQMQLDKDLLAILKSFSQDAHPMAMLISLTGALAAFYPEGFNFKDATTRTNMIENIIAKMPIIAASCYCHSINQDVRLAKSDLSYSANFLFMMFGQVDPIIEKAFDRILLLHADHEQNASTSTVRIAGSSGTHPFAAIAAGISCLWGPAHGGANEAVLKMLSEISSEENVDNYILGVKNKQYKLMGFGHRVYKNMDPRASIMRETCYEVLDFLGMHNDPLFKLAMKLEKRALSDEYFIEKKLYPNVDFYSGIILKAIGIPINMFTVIFALARVVGWASQWQEMITEQNMKISRPRQLYTGYTSRDYVSIDKR